MASATHRTAAVAVLVAAAAAVYWLDPFGMGSTAQRLRPDDATVVALGQRIYSQHCLACHGAQLQGQPDWRTPGADGRMPAPPHDATGHTWHHPDALLFRLTKFGVAEVSGMKDYRSAMPVYAGTLSDAEIIAVLSWIKAQWPAELRARHDQLNAKAGR